MTQSIIIHLQFKTKVQKQEFSEVNQNSIGDNSTRQERQSYVL